MKHNSLHRHYNRLTPEERFRLDVLAMAREDERVREAHEHLPQARLHYERLGFRGAVGGSM